MYEIIDARSKGWQLRETEGGSRKGLLIRGERFEISVRHSLSQNAITKSPPPHPPGGESHAVIFRGVSIPSFLKKKKKIRWGRARAVPRLFRVFNRT